MKVISIATSLSMLLIQIVTAADPAIPETPATLPEDSASPTYYPTMSIDYNNTESPTYYPTQRTSYLRSAAEDDDEITDSPTYYPTAHDDDESTTESPTYYPTSLNATESPTSDEVGGW